MVTTVHPPGGSDPPQSIPADPPYIAPSVTYLGTLRELTEGGTPGPSDGVGGAGGVGSLAGPTGA
jgi:hypothetical protein